MKTILLHIGQLLLLLRSFFGVFWIQKVLHTPKFNSRGADRQTGKCKIQKHQYPILRNLIVVLLELISCNKCKVDWLSCTEHVHATWACMCPVQETEAENNLENLMLQKNFWHSNYCFIFFHIASAPSRHFQEEPQVFPSGLLCTFSFSRTESPGVCVWFFWVSPFPSPFDSQLLPMAS